MMRKDINTLKVLLFFFLLSITCTSTAQSGTITGKISDSQSKESLIGVSVTIKGTTIGAATDLDGNFVLPGISPGTYSLNISYIGYQIHVEQNLVVRSNQETILEINLTPENLRLDEVQVVARANCESENVLLLQQQKMLLATQTVGSKEMSRKGVSNAQAAVAQVSGISKQEGVKNVSVRGLGDRYNATLLNGFPVPSEDPEYKNIALRFFSSDVIQNIEVNKVFDAGNNSDVCGAVININSKELFLEKTFNFEAGAGINSEVTGTDFLKQDGTDYFGFSNNKRPSQGRFNFPNSLDPTKAAMPLNHNYGISGGKMLRLNKPENSLSFFAVASHNSDYSYTKETVKNANSNGTIYQDQTGDKYSINISQLALANINLKLNRRYEITYNFMLLHANDQYVGQFKGLHSEKHQDSDTYTGFLRRQQSNDNLLITNQIISRLKLFNNFELGVGGAFNTIKGLEPDRRENYLSQKTDGSYNLTGSNRQKRFYSELRENDFNIRTYLRYKLTKQQEIEKSNITFGYTGRFVDDSFEAVEYNFGAYPGYFQIDDLKLDAVYNNTNYEAGKFTMTEGDTNKYQLSKHIHSAYIEATYQFTDNFTANAGLRTDHVDMTVSHYVQHVSPGKESLKNLYYLPNINMKYNINTKNSLRLGISKSYTLPQSKEISPYQYVNIGFASQGNPDIKPSDNYNIDLKWDYYLSPSELISLCGFYKHIINPIGRVDQGNSAGLLTYDNISPDATVAGMEMEIRKNIINKVNTGSSRVNKLSFGLNASYIHSSLQLDIANTTPRKTRLEGASPFITNSDISYNLTSGEKTFIVSMVLNYFSDRIYTLGTRNYNDIIEKGVMTLDLVSSFKISKQLTFKIKAANLLNPAYRLTREIGQRNEEMTLNEYKKGSDISISLSFEL